MKTKKNGFTLIEVAIATAIFAIALLGLLAVFIGCSELNEFAKNLTLAINAAQQQLERIRGLDFSQISTEDGNTFQVSGIGTSGGGIEVSTVEADAGLLDVRITVSWQQKDGRVIGEDTNLNGQIDAGEDSNLNGSLDSPAQVETLITEKEE